MIKGAVVAHKMGPTVLRQLQQTQYLDYWRSRTGAGTWFKNADIDGHAAARKRARKDNPQNTVLFAIQGYERPATNL